MAVPPTHAASPTSKKLSVDVDELVAPAASFAAAKVGVARKARLEGGSALATSGEDEDELDTKRCGAAASNFGRATWEAGFARRSGGGTCPCVAARDPCSPRPEAAVFLVYLVVFAILSVLNVVFAVPTAGFTLAARSLALTLGAFAAWPATATAGAAETPAAPDAIGVEAPEFSSGCVCVFVSCVATVATTWTGVDTGGMAACFTWVVTGGVTGLITGGLTGGGV
jgi:hypothetical protein